MVELFYVRINNHLRSKFRADVFTSVQISWVIWRKYLTRVFNIKYRFYFFQFWGRLRAHEGWGRRGWYLDSLARRSSVCIPFKCVHSARLIPVRSISAIMAHVTYAVPFLWAFTGKNGTIQRNRAFTKENVLKRLALGASRKDLFYYLVCLTYRLGLVYLNEANYRVARSFLNRSAPLSVMLHGTGV
jgi:hypothetical protein